MYSFHYEYIVPKYGDNAKLLFTDTDSLTYEVKTEDIYKDMLKDMDMFDTSEYPTDHLLYSNQNKKALGKMKDESFGEPHVEFVGLRPKMYSFKGGKKTAKGIKKSVVKNELSHDDYRRCLLNRELKKANMTQIRSYNHKVYSVAQSKIGLSPYDDKRYILDNGISTLAYGHYSILDTVNSDDDVDAADSNDDNDTAPNTSTVLYNEMQDDDDQMMVEACDKESKKKENEQRDEQLNMDIIQSDDDQIMIEQCSIESEKKLNKDNEEQLNIIVNNDMIVELIQSDDDDHIIIEECDKESERYKMNRRLNT